MISQTVSSGVFTVVVPTNERKEMKFLMCVPDFFGVDYVINPWMEGQVGRVDHKIAMGQWVMLRRHIAKFAEVTLMSPRIGLPDMVFTANAGFVLGNLCLLSRFKYKERQGEEKCFEEWFRDRKYDTVFPTVPFEGAGDLLYDQYRVSIWSGKGFRSEVNDSLLWRLYGRAVYNLVLKDKRFYHLDTCFCPLSHGYVLYYPPAFDDSSVDLIRKRVGEESLIEVSEEDALNFSCNAVEIYSNIIMNEASADLRDKLKKSGFNLITTPLTEFMKAGGSAKCLTLRVDQ